MRVQQEKVAEFHQMFGLDVRWYPTVLEESRKELRVQLMAEELGEVVEALDSGELAEIAKELGDLLYVVLGTAVEMGLDMQDVFDQVHESNLSKLWTRAEAKAALEHPSSEAVFMEEHGNKYVVRRHDGKALKPPSYEKLQVALRTPPAWRGRG